jgi:hypothetical protein
MHHRDIAMHAYFACSTPWKGTLEFCNQFNPQHFNFFLSLEMANKPPVVIDNGTGYGIIPYAFNAVMVNHYVLLSSIFFFFQATQKWDIQGMSNPNTLSLRHLQRKLTKVEFRGNAMELKIWIFLSEMPRFKIQARIKSIILFAMA